MHPCGHEEAEAQLPTPARRAQLLKQSQPVAPASGMGSVPNSFSCIHQISNQLFV